MKKKLYMLFIMLTLSGMLMNSAWALSSMRCGCCDILRNGDSALKVLECLGEPEFRSYTNDNIGLLSPIESINVEFWFYRQDDWVYRITIDDGIVSDIDIIGRD